VEIDGEPYWDGGYSGNPALWPLIYETRALDLLLVRINPLRHGDLPDTALEIHDRLNEITFNEVLIGEMRAIRFVQKLVASGRVRADEYKCLRLHMIGDDEHLGPLDAASKLSSDGAQIQRLFGWGRAAADAWLAKHRAAIGVEGTVDIDRQFLDVR
jgi:NTE family protein